MPDAGRADTARQWVTGRAIACWVCFAGDLDDGTRASLRADVAASRADGARWALVTPPRVEPPRAELDLADEVVVGAAPPQPWGVFAAMQAAGTTDVRALGAITIEALEGFAAALQRAMVRHAELVSV